MTGKDKIVKFISTLLIISIIVPTVLFSNPKKAAAFNWSSWLSDFFNGAQVPIEVETATAVSEDASVNTSSLGLQIKDAAIEVGKQLLKAVAKRALQEMTKSTINWINGGFHGAPLFLENPDSFFKDIAKYEVKTLVDQFGYDSLKYPFGRDFALNTINSYKRTLDDNASYSLSKVINDPVLLKSYQTDFNVGGWNAHLINTQYPQNNYLGFQMIANEELARRIENDTGKVQTTLQQGQGFLSPQTCPSNPDYNNGKNEWKQPSFDEAQYVKDHPYDGLRPQEWMTALAKAKLEWAEKNTCPRGLVNTTPGSVVSSQIMNALGSGQRQGELSAAMGNSMSAIFDALLNKFIDDGLNSLASKSNPKNDPDTWSYEGQTLGSPTGGANSSWDLGPGEPIYINKFKKDIDDGITNNETELQLISQITENLSAIWPKSRTLDVCLPGPDVGWEGRLENEKNKADGRIQKAYSDGSDKEIDQGEKVKRELKFAIDFFKDWIINQMITELPNSILYLDAVKDVEELSQESNELTDAKRLKAQGLARLKSIKSALDKIIELDDNGNIIQPEIGSVEEQILIQLKKQYDATRTSISNTKTVDDRQDKLLVTQEKLDNLDNLIIKCGEERIEKGWPNPAGLAINPEQAYFCDLPIIGGYTHEMFNGLSLTHPELPMVNAQKVFKYKVTTIKSFLTGAFTGNASKTSYVNIKLSCSNIYNASVIDYKGNLPGSTNLELYNPPKNDLDEGPSVGTCEFPGETETETETQDNVTQEYCEENGGGWTQNETP